MPSRRSSPRRGNVRRALRQQLESLGRSGMTQVPRAKQRPATKPAAPASQGSTPQAAASVSPPAAEAAAPVPTLPAAVQRPAGTATALDPVAALDVIRREVAACTRCGELCRTRTQTVFGVGNPRPRLCFLGEAPGADEDAQGEPFVGRAGQLLTKIIEACTLQREDVYILNVLKCRPPGNRTPLPDEVEHCREYLDRQLAVLRPEFICCLGSVAAQSLLRTATPISKLRGTFLEYAGAAVLCTYHPAYLLRNPAAKRDVWEDMQRLMARMGIPLPARQ